MAYVVAAYGVAWAIHMIYLFTLGAREKELRQSLETLKALGRE